MPLTKEFKTTILERAKVDAVFRHGLLREAINEMLRGEVAVGRLLLRDYVNATLGFEALAQKTSKSPKSLMRMLSTQGNPTAQNLFEILHILQQEEGVDLELVS